MKNLVSIINNQVLTDSLRVAECFEKRHCDVIRRIESLETPENFGRRNFASAERMVKNNLGFTVKSKIYNLTKDGFVLLVMGFTGKKATAFKIKYIEAFNAMEKKLKEKQQISNARPAISENGKLRYLHPELGMLSPMMKAIKECCRQAVREELGL